MVTFHLRRRAPARSRLHGAIAVLIGLSTAPAWAQPAPPAPALQPQTPAQASPPPEAAAGTLAPVTVSADQSPPTLSVGGFGDEALVRSPLSARVVPSAVLAERHATRMSDLIQTDASATDAYNAIGYWDYVTLRGFVLEASSNYRRDGLPISAEGALGLENRDSIELLKGTSGIQAGISAPGGLVNHVVKRPTAKPVRNIRLDVNDHGNRLAHVDIGHRFGADQAWGYRLNVAAEDLSSATPGADGSRHLAALAMDWRMAPGRLLEVELEHTRRRQPGVPGLSLLGGRLPAPDPFINLNRQSWSQPGVMAGLTGSIRYEHALSNRWSFNAHAGSQRLTADDFLAYPFGCYDAGTDVYYADRYCPNGDVDLYDYRSLNERRQTGAVQLQLKGLVETGALTHHVGLGVMRSRFTERGQPQADNNAAAGTGNVFSLPQVPANPLFTDPYTLRTDTATEWFAHDRIVWSPNFSTWLGLRHSRIGRDSVRTDGSRATSYAQSFNTPWLALAWQWTPADLLYASTGQGVETAVAPGRSRYTNAGQPLAPLKSRQWELGWKRAVPNGQFSATLFSISRPRSGDAGTCDVANSCTLQRDGEDLHRGVELAGERRLGAWTVDGSAMWLNAERRNGRINPALNGLRPTNVPEWVVRAGVRYAVSAVPGLSLEGRVSHEGRRAIVPDGSLMLPSWTRVDAAVALQSRVAGQPATWRLSVLNAANRRYFKESPFMYGHVYLFPAAPRTVHLSLDVGF